MTDTFRNGGELVDLGTWYAGRDKIQHAIAGFVLAVVCRRVGFGRLAALVVVLFLACLWGAFEDFRYRRWRAAIRVWRYTAGLEWMARYGTTRPLAPPSRPRFCDEFSWRDIVATLAGALVALP